MAFYHSKYGGRSRKVSPTLRKFVLSVLLIIILVFIVIGYLLYQVVIKPNVWTPDQKEIVIYIPSGSDYEDVKRILYEKGLIIHRNNFEWLAREKKYPDLIKPGRYTLEHGWSNDRLINLLRSGNQTPVNLTFNNVRDVFQLSGRVSQQIEADSASIAHLLTDSIYTGMMGFNSYTIPSLFIPNTYEFYWTTNAEGFVSRMLQEHRKFWNEERLSKAKELKMSEAQVSTLASIIDKETNMNDEKAQMAGVYINRLKSGWRLQADPTLVFAAGDFSLRRVLDIHKTIESPYNTYKYPGLPPGPICIPSIASIDAVLNYEAHNYYFFCAKDDFSGYHVFARTNLEHELNAWKYRRALDRMNINK
jgi:UPF0755 protein